MDQGYLKPGDLLNHSYKIEKLVGRGGTGEVYRARSAIVEGRPFAIKILKPELSSEEQFLDLMKREATALEAIEHDAVVKYYGLERTEAGLFFLRMSFVEGPSLHDRLCDGPVPPEDLFAIARRVAGGLEVAHARGTYHRDLSPSNVILRDGRPDLATVIDFGIARDSRSKKTIVGGGFAGTYEYSPPEQLKGLADARSDLYSLGASLLAASRGSDPALPDGIVQIIEEKSKKPDISGLDPTLARVVGSLVEPDPDARIQSAAALIKLLDEVAAAAALKAKPAAPKTQIAPRAAPVAPKPVAEDASPAKKVEKPAPSAKPAPAAAGGLSGLMDELNELPTGEKPVPSPPSPKRREKRVKVEKEKPVPAKKPKKPASPAAAVPAAASRKKGGLLLPLAGAAALVLGGGGLWVITQREEPPIVDPKPVDDGPVDLEPVDPEPVDPEPVDPERDDPELADADTIDDTPPQPAPNPEPPLAADECKFTPPGGDGPVIVAEGAAPNQYNVCRVGEALAGFVAAPFEMDLRAAAQRGGVVTGTRADGTIGADEFMRLSITADAADTRDGYVHLFALFGPGFVTNYMPSTPYPAGYDKDRVVGGQPYVLQVPWDTNPMQDRAKDIASGDPARERASRVPPANWGEPFLTPVVMKSVVANLNNLEAFFASRPESLSEMIAYAESLPDDQITPLGLHHYVLIESEQPLFSEKRAYFETAASFLPDLKVALDAAPGEVRVTTATLRQDR